MRRGDYEVRNCLAACILRSACRCFTRSNDYHSHFSLLFLHFDKRFAIFANRNRINFPLFLSNIFIRVFIHFIVWRPACLPPAPAAPAFVLRASIMLFGRSASAPSFPVPPSLSVPLRRAAPSPPSLPKTHKGINFGSPDINCKNMGWSVRVREERS